jgi:hypothetical protein
MKQRNSLLLLLLLFLCLISRLTNFVGIGTNDDTAYVYNARDLAVGRPIIDICNQIGFRFGMTFPLALLTVIFGINDIVYSSYSLFYSIITCALIYLIAVRLWGVGAAIISCLLWIAYPLQLVYDTQLSPSNQHATCVAAALFLYFYSTNDKSSGISKFTFSKWRTPLLLILCGIFLGFGWWLNELFVTFILVVLPFLVLMRPKIKHLLWIIAGFLFIIFIEFLIVKILTGSWLAKINCILETEKAVVSNIDPEYLPSTLFNVWDLNFLYEGRFGIIWYLFIVVTILALLMSGFVWKLPVATRSHRGERPDKKDKLPLALALGCWLWLAYIQWGVQSLNGDPIAKHIRYISMIVPIQCLVFGAIFGYIFKFSKKLKLVLVILFILLFIHLFWFGIRAVDTVKVTTDDFKKIAEFLMSLDLKNDDIIYTNGHTGDYVEIFSKGRLNIQKVENIEEPAKVPQKGILVTESSRDIVELPEYVETLPEWYLFPPSHWPLIHVVSGKKIGVYKEFDPKIYRILPKVIK